MSNQIGKYFKKLSFDIEQASRNKWIIDKICIETYPLSFFYTTFKDSDRVFLCHKDSLIFALNTLSGSGISGVYYKGFINDNDFHDIVSQLINENNFNYNFLKAEFLVQKFNNYKDFKEKIKQLDINESDIELTIKTIGLDKFDYKTIYRNIGEDLFNNLED